MAGSARPIRLSRPPGTTPSPTWPGASAFLNNAAIAAQHWLRDHCVRPAVLDIDVHHGNGTQGIFFRRGDVLTVSIHADPLRGSTRSSGAMPMNAGPARGLGANLNLPLERGTGDDGVLRALDAALARIDAFGAGAIVVALGLDAHVNDPFQGLAVTTPGFARITAAIAGLGLPVLYVQEGGYLSDDLGPNLTSALEGAQA